MSEAIITVENLGKKYALHHQRNEGYKTLRDTLTEKATEIFRRNGKADQTREEFWALRDVNFEVKQGAVIGIVGRNGAGKTTLLKILSRITEPTTGKVHIKGRVASLLEVGTGFHPELSGRENIFLNGAILGMSRAEIKARFDEIVGFAEIEKFLDTPVKRYSSGMYVRLAFAVAAHLDPEILVIDEVLAVGDAQFQTKCIGKMQDIADKDLRTVLFVSHNMGAINKLCDLAILLDCGNIRSAGKTPEVVSHYLSSLSDGYDGAVTLQKTHSEAYFTRIAILDRNDRCSTSISVTSGFRVQLEYDILERIPGLEVSLSLFDSNGSKIFSSSLSKSKPDCFFHDPGHYVAAVNIPGNFLAPGTYNITADLHQPNIRYLDRRHEVMKLSIVETGSDEYRYGGRELGSVLVAFDWNVEKQ